MRKPMNNRLATLNHCSAGDVLSVRCDHVQPHQAFTQVMSGLSKSLNKMMWNAD